MRNREETFAKPEQSDNKHIGRTSLSRHGQDSGRHQVNPIVEPQRGRLKVDPSRVDPPLDQKKR